MNPTLAELIKAAHRRGLRHSFPADVVNDDFLELTDGSRTLVVNKTKTPFLSTVHAKLVTDKYLSGRMMEQAGLPIAPKRLSQEFAEDDVRFLETNGEIITKPNRMDRGVGVTGRIRTREGLIEGYAKARVYGPVLLEKQVIGKEYRILVINGRAIATLERKPVTLIGDGVSTLQMLIEKLNTDPRRGSSSENKPLRPIRLDGDLGEIPQVGTEVQLSFANHLDSGGIACDRTDEAHPENLHLAIRAAQLFSIDVAGIDLICPDIANPILPGDAAAIIDVNPCPDLRWHIYPAEGKSRPVADEFVEYLFPRRLL